MDTEKNRKDTKEKKEDRDEGSTVESVVGQLIPGLGGIVRALEKSSPEFRRRIAQTDAEIAHRIETGWSVKPDVNYGYSIRPLTERKGVTRTSAKKEPEDLIVETEERELIIDIFEEKEYISVIAELPGVEEKDIGTRLKDNTLEISAGKYCKTFGLPSVPKSIIERTYNNGILQLKIERKDNVS